ncbi:glycoside hydrolase family 78 protein [Streptomyces sp. NBC_01352]|uniref:family 78 glycoside hydrolase catalytic domain n=1 Tax=unclassified Streptomyces TaxID=2593676 RepID=UPI00225AD96E|nr:MULTISPECIES: family 78 glycoside hydrolase catalytic domain [unclassified Streptomyces]MCX4703292.1 glycoside hydrolase family 78 protein [Streptomyces sp. NBC_01373]
MTEQTTTDAPHRLRFEHLDDAVLGTDVARPRLSWQLPVGATRQTAYEIAAGEWSTGVVRSAERVLVPYTGPEPSARERVEWRVRVWTDLGESDWSAPAFWEMGLLERSDWSASWIRPHEQNVPDPGHRPVYALHSHVELPGPITSARAYVTAHGIYELVVNGQRIGDQELTPGFTAYRSNLQVQTYDLTTVLHEGANDLGAFLSDGWYRGLFGYSRTYDNFGDRTAFLAQFEVIHTDGSTTVVGTGLGWGSTVSDSTEADLLDGQRVVQRTDGFRWDRRDWQPVLEPTDPLCADWSRLCATPAPPVRRVRSITPVSVTTLEGGRHIVDLGENTSGWIHLDEAGPGSEIVLTHGEALDADGDVTTDHLRPDMGSGVLLPFHQIDSVVFVGDGQAFEPRHTTHGFQYVAIDGLPGPLGTDNLHGVEVRTDLCPTGTFHCSDRRIELLHEAAVRSWRTNACDVPTDCPQRERAAWTGDYQVFVSTAAFLDGIAGFTDKWLKDLASDQVPNGMVRNYVPSPEAAVGGVEGSSGWGDAAVSVPWQMWQSYRDREVLARQYPSAVAWLEFVETTARTARAPERIEAHPEAPEHEQFLWDTGFHWGEWLEPGVEIALFEGEHSIVATAYFAHSARLLAKTAEVLGKTEDAARWTELAANVERAWATEFIGADGRLARDSQATYVRALRFGLIPEHLVPSAVEHLVELIRADGTHLSTGFLSTGMLLPVLADNGRADVAFDLLFQDTSPSWLTMIDRGATTIWEHWDGIDAKGTPSGSLNHYSKGAVIGFLHRYVAGLRPLESHPGYERFVVEPVIDDRLDWARATLETPFGLASSSWRREDGAIRYEVVVPADTECEFRVGEPVVLGPGTHVITF